jgi:S-adenosylmethionine decarboxylase
VSARPHRPAGLHLLADFHGILDENLVSCEAIDALLRAGATAAGATILGSYFHSFGPQQGVTGMLLLAESHISIHTWPEFGFAAADIFMCGDCAPQLALDVIERALAPSSRVIRTIERGGAGSL